MGVSHSIRENQTNIAAEAAPEPSTYQESHKASSLCESGPFPQLSLLLVQIPRLRPSEPQLRLPQEVPSSCSQPPCHRQATHHCPRVLCARPPSFAFDTFPLFSARHAMATLELTSELQNENFWRHRKKGRSQTETRGAMPGEGTGTRVRERQGEGQAGDGASQKALLRGRESHALQGTCHPLLTWQTKGNWLLPMW